MMAPLWDSDEIEAAILGYTEAADELPDEFGRQRGRRARRQRRVKGGRR